MSTEAIRLRLYSILGSIEDDLREIFSKILLADKTEQDLLPPELVSVLIDRRRAESETSGTALYNYANLGDIIDVVQKYSHLGGEELRKHMKLIHSKLHSLIPIRNRVMHIRPLLFEDMPTVVQTAKFLTNAKPVFWSTLSETMRKLETDHSFILKIEFKPDTENGKSILNNLPLPEFDDTGFIGRDEEIVKIIKAIKGAYPVVTVSGEGGLGKTALALRVCYDLLDDPECPFEAIIWTSAKATKLTTKEIIQIEGCVSSSVGVFDAATRIIDDTNNKEPLERLIDQLNSFPILLVIDNLETVLDENIRTLVQNVPSGSKILFTTKKSIGAYDFPVPLAPLSAKESAFLFRASARFWGQKDLAKLSGEIVDEYCERLQKNPLIIRWFVQAVADGQSPQRILANPKLVLKYCLSSVFDKLSAPSMQVISTLSFESRGITEPVICYFTDLEPEVVQTSLGELIASNLVRIDTISDESRDPTFSPSEMAQLYIRNYYTEAGIDEAKLVKRRRSLAFEKEKHASFIGADPFNYHNIAIRDDGDFVVTRILKESLAKLHSKEISDALDSALRAKELSPNYFETDRVLAQVYAEDSQLMKADSKFQSAISLNPNHAPLKLWYGDFLLKKMDDAEAANDQYADALERFPA